MKRIILCLCVSIIFQSCATLFNSKYATVKINSTENVTLIFKSDTFQMGQKPIKIFPLRSKDSLRFLVFKDSLFTELKLKPKESLAYFLNLPFTGLIGILADYKMSDKHYTYRNHLNVEKDSSSGMFMLAPFNYERLKAKRLFIYTTPLSILDFANGPKFTIGTEYFIAKDWSLSGEYGIQYIEVNRSRNGIKEKGYSLRLEAKRYFKPQLASSSLLNHYIGLEYRYLNLNQNASILYNFKDVQEEMNVQLLNDDFAVYKRINIVNLKYGFLTHYNKALYFDFYVGFGIRHRSIKNKFIEFDSKNHDLEIPNHDLFNTTKNKIEDLYTPKSLNFILGFKVGYKL